jgi:hypothetical protein
MPSHSESATARLERLLHDAQLRIEAAEAKAENERKQAEDERHSRKAAEVRAEDEQRIAKP